MKRARKCKAERIHFDATLAVFWADKLSYEPREVVLGRLVHRRAWEDMCDLFPDREVGPGEAKRIFRAGVEALAKLIEWEEPGRIKRRPSRGPRKNDLL